MGWGGGGARGRAKYFMDVSADMHTRMHACTQGEETEYWF